MLLWDKRYVCNDVPTRICCFVIKLTLRFTVFISSSSTFLVTIYHRDFC